MRKLFRNVLMLLLTIMLIISCGGSESSSEGESIGTTNPNSYCPTSWQGKGTIPACISVTSVSPEEGSLLNFENNNQDKLTVKLTYNYDGVDAFIEFGWTTGNSVETFNAVTSCFDPPGSSTIFLDRTDGKHWGKFTMELDLNCILPPDDSDHPYQLVFWITTAEVSLLDDLGDDTEWGANYATLIFN